MTQDLKVIWNLYFNILPLPNNDEVVDGITFVKESPKVNTIVEIPLSNYQRSSTYYLLYPPIHETVEKIRFLILLKAIHNCIFEPIEMVFINQKIINDNHLKENDVEFRLEVENSWEQNYNIYEENDRFDDAIRYWNTGFKVKSYGRKEDLIEIAKWVVMAQGEKSEMKSFIMLYLAFNSLYSMFSNYVKKASSSQPKAEIKNLFYNLLTDVRIKEISKINANRITCLSKLDIISSDNKENYSLALKNVINNNCETKHILFQAALCVHQIRNELFHYGIGMSDRERKIQISKFF